MHYAHYPSAQAALVRAIILIFLAWVLVVQRHVHADPPRGQPTFPVKVAEGGRYLVDQKGIPFLIAGESPQALMVNLTNNPTRSHERERPFTAREGSE